MLDGDLISPVFLVFYQPRRHDEALPAERNSYKIRANFAGLTEPNIANVEDAKLGPPNAP